ncbi:MAG: translation initiation factor IF-2, partial [Candidatus Methanomethylophilaceae archaeon]
HPQRGFDMAIRQPIVSVLGHVDHGKTMLLDTIRGTSVIAREAGLITQHIGATEVPIDHIYKVCGKLIGPKRFDVPGLLFIDTPGHHSFITLRARGGSLADLAVLVIDVKEGIKPQTIESIRILKQYKTPFIIAMNKVDTIPGWQYEKNRPFILAEKQQAAHAIENFNARLYDIIGALSMEGISADRYDRIDNFTRTVALVPVSAKTGEGIADLLLVLIGLAQRFLEEQLRQESGPGRGTILEIKEERGLGQTLDIILYSGTLRRGDTVALGTRGPPVITKVKAILKPKPLDEIRDPRDRFDSVKELQAAAGVKLSCQNIEGAIAGGAIRVIRGKDDEALDDMVEESKVNIEVEDEGVTIKADAIGSLEALAYEAKNAGVPIRRYGVGEISRRDIVEVAALGEKVNKVILGFNSKVSADAQEALEGTEIKVFSSDIVYRLIEEYEEWVEAVKSKRDLDKRSEFAFPAKFMILPNCIFRASKPAIVGVRILAGRVRPGQRIIAPDGREIGRVRSLRSGEDTVRESKQGDEVAMAIEGLTVGRQADAEDVLYIDLLESAAKELSKLDLNDDERLTLEETIAIKRKEDPFWAM